MHSSGLALATISWGKWPSRDHGGKILISPADWPGVPPPSFSPNWNQIPPPFTLPTNDPAIPSTKMKEGEVIFLLELYNINISAKHLCRRAYLHWNGGPLHSHWRIIALQFSLSTTLCNSWSILSVSQIFTLLRIFIFSSKKCLCFFLAGRIYM